MSKVRGTDRSRYKKVTEYFMLQVHNIFILYFNSYTNNTTTKYFFDSCKHAVKKTKKGASRNSVW